jgi:hypothetical protein
VAVGEAELLAVRYLSFGEEALADPRGAFEGEVHPPDINDVNPYPRHDKSLHGSHRLYVTADEPQTKGL